MTPYQAIALDMDGTLLTRDHRISAATREALEEARRRGIKVILVTGRHYMLARPFHHELGLDTPIICSNGAYLYDPVHDGIVRGDPLPKPALATLLEVLDGESMGALIHLSEGIAYLGCQEQVTKMRNWSARQPEHLNITLLPLEARPDLLAESVWKFELFGDDPAQLHDVVASRVQPLPLNQDWAAPYAIELVDRRCSKGNRLTQWAASEGIDMAQIVAFGDNNNDISMFAQVGLAVAMGNAASQIRAQAHKVTADHNEDGIALALQRWVLA
ncbi:Cof-type HAD-IIB family hydrolase [Aeromonas simiae]|uniref:Cof-type HAD-IIB family hydrolase n=1 Tax=Aeromonas simiae TaxID=218936 RepID=A0A5J6WRM0_9GAMM|nr:Cof-type HAD-IIB family hydrolase [Aeromonas simiae]QFI53759.1 Cof-type HAD-IIB family hydrolase [Aeromonas simiae]